MQTATANLQPANSLAAEPPVSAASLPGGGAVRHTVWGLDPVQLHARYWASFGVGVVRVGEASRVPKGAELFLLLDPVSLPLFPLSPAMRLLKWVEPTVLTLRLQERRDDGYREVVICEGDERLDDDDLIPGSPAARSSQADRFLRFERIYDGADLRAARVALTPDREIAQLWQQASSPLSAWKRLRRFVPPAERAVLNLDARIYDRLDDREVALMLDGLVRDWRRPQVTVGRAQPHADGKVEEPRVWHDPTADVSAARFHGRVWVGAGRQLPAGTVVVGPRVVWDSAEHRPDPAADDFDWAELEPQRADWATAGMSRGDHDGVSSNANVARLNGAVNGSATKAGDGESDAELATDSGRRPDTIVAHDPGELSDAAKRLFDLAFSAVALLLTLPVWLFIIAAILIEDGRPIFFGHVRQSRGGKPFRCWKFRSMRKDAEEIKKRLIAEGKNEADGAQFFMEDDPRITRVGKILRKTNLDELPQFWNVLRGNMSVVGPRPSPDKENQFNPAWREARLSVRPGITGLWQVRRTRSDGNDFQEWIQYDLEYVQTRSFRNDMRIIVKTVTMIFRKLTRD